MDPLERVCPTCDVEPGIECKSASGKKTTTHHARFTGVASKRNILKPRKDSPVQDA